MRRTAALSSAAVVVALAVSVSTVGAGPALASPAGTASVGLTSFKAAAAKGLVTVTWKTANETEILGFNVYRTDPKGASKKVTRALITAKKTGQPAGTSYKFLDRKAKKGLRYSYRLQVLSPQGGKVFFGHAKILAR